jgi:hypothetical protein
MMLMNDRANTRIRIQGVTSYAPDKNIDYSTQQSWPTISMTIGSVVLILVYFEKSDRDADIQRLDEAIDKD